MPPYIEEEWVWVESAVWSRGPVFEDDLVKIVWRATEPTRGWLMQCRCGAGG
jgi:hypothetical protein